jgi:hypothetical protein
MTAANHGRFAVELFPPRPKSSKPASDEPKEEARRVFPTIDARIDRRVAQWRQRRMGIGARASCLTPINASLLEMRDVVLNVL